MGVTLAAWASWREDHCHPVTTAADLAAASNADLAEMIRSRYWSPVRAESLPPGIDLQVYDFGFGSGPQTSGRVLQQVLGGLRADGVIGAMTLAAVMRVNDRAGLIRRLSGAHLAYYQSIKGAGGWSAFGNGWRRRNDDRTTLALQMDRSGGAPGPVRAV